MINTLWHVKIDAQELFYFMILSGGGTWSKRSSCFIEGKAWTLHRCPWIFLTTTMNALPRTMREPIVPRWGAIGYNMKLQMLLLRWEVIMKNKTKWELSALVYSHRLDERTDVESQINGLYLTSWCRHHNTALGSKRCIRRTQCHHDALWWYVFLSACSCTWSTKLAPGLTFRWWIGEMHPVHQICMQELHCQVPPVARHLIGSDKISYL